MSLTPKNWKSFQHYKERTPAWIKLHKGLLDDFTFSRLPLASRALAPLLWLLASEYEDGCITASQEEIAFRLRMTETDLIEALSPLIESGFFCASETLAEPEQKASLEKEDIDKKKEEIDSGANAPRAEKKSRKGNATALPDGYCLSDKIAAYGAEHGLSASEMAREHQRFCNHAKQSDRRCVDWGAAERNWFLGAAEKLGKSPGATATPEKIHIEQAVAIFAKSGIWSRHAPVNDISQVPPEILAKHGLAPDGRKLEALQ